MSVGTLGVPTKPSAHPAFDHLLRTTTIRGATETVLRVMINLRTTIMLALLTILPLVLVACGKGKGGGY